MGESTVDPSCTIDVAAPRSSDRTFPICHWDRHERSGFLGAGGMDQGDPAIDSALADAWSEIMLIESVGSSDARGAFFRVIESCDNAIRVEPMQSAGYARKAWAYATLGHQQLGRSAAPKPSLNLAIEAGKKAVERSVENAFAHVARRMSGRTISRRASGWAS